MVTLESKYTISSVSLSKTDPFPVRFQISVRGSLAMVIQSRREYLRLHWTWGKLESDPVTSGRLSSASQPFPDLILYISRAI